MWVKNFEIEIRNYLIYNFQINSFSNFQISILYQTVIFLGNFM